MNKIIKFSQGGYIKNPNETEYTFPEVGDQFFWRVVPEGEYVKLELRQWRQVGSGKSSLFGIRGPFLANQEEIDQHAKQLANALNKKQQNLSNAEKWAGDYASGKGDKVKW